MSLDTAQLRSDLFDKQDWKARQREAVGLPKARFQLNRPYEPTTPLLAYKFVASLYGLYGRELRPIDLSDGCIAIELAVKEPSDVFGRPFPHLVLYDEMYHDIFQSFSVDRIYLHGFPEMENLRPPLTVGLDGKPAVLSA